MGLMAANAHLKAQKINDLWLSMPDSMMPSVSRESRKEMLNHALLGFGRTVKNKFEEPVRIDSMATDFIRVTLSASEQWQLLLLPGESQEPVVCQVKTFYGPAAESSITLYNKVWEKVGEYRPSWENFLAHPDTLSDDDYQALCNRITPIIYQAVWNGTTQTMQLNLSLPFLTREDQEKIQPLILQRNLKWRENSFK